MPSRTPWFLLPAIALGLAAAPAAADLLPPEATPCQGKTAGAECDLTPTTKGVCVKVTASRPGPGSKEWIECKPAGAATSTPSAAPSSSGKAAEPTTEKKGSGCDFSGGGGSEALPIFALAAAGLVAARRRRRGEQAPQRGTR